MLLTPAQFLAVQAHSYWCAAKLVRHGSLRDGEHRSLSDEDRNTRLHLIGDVSRLAVNRCLRNASARDFARLQRNTTPTNPTGGDAA
jgi:hypothetical protein